VQRNSFEFEAVIDQQGQITVPGGFFERLGESPTRRVHVRLSSKELSAELKKRGVTEDEIDRISEMQLEERNQVEQFLLAEGSLRACRRWRKLPRSSRREK
jgi:bifunctional DNA-binding transcriptional regulator/antitoxin component of YhaV-PrlF toxin-antitoxin module